MYEEALLPGKEPTWAWLREEHSSRHVLGSVGLPLYTHVPGTELLGEDAL